MKKRLSTYDTLCPEKLLGKAIIALLAVFLLSCSLMYAQEEGPIVAPSIDLQQFKQPIKHTTTKQTRPAPKLKSQKNEPDNKHIGPPVNLEALRNVKLNKADIEAIRTPNCPKLSTALCRLYMSCDDEKAVSDQATRNGLELNNNKVTVTIYPEHGKRTAEIDLNALRSLGVEIDLQASRSLRAFIPVNQLEAATNVTGVGRIAPPNKPVANNTIISEGVMWMNSDTWQMNGHGGAGVKIGVIDLGFASLSAAQAAGELPANVNTVDFSGTGIETGTEVHGTAVAEIIYDVAPDAELYLYKISDATSLELAKNDALANAVNIVNMSVNFFNSGGYYNGTGPVCDIVQDAIDGGITWVNSAGNFALNHYRNNFDDVGNGNHNFNNGGDLNPIITNGSYYSPLPGEYIVIDLNWDDYPASGQDYDLELYQSLDGVSWNLLGGTGGVQNGTQLPEERIVYQNNVYPAAYAVAVRKTSATADIDFTMFNRGGGFLAFSTQANSILDPATVEDVITVGAIDKDLYLLGPQASYSSQGPTNSGVTKPDIAAPTNTESFAYNGPFGGTSAASPHVAAAVAQIKSRFPAFTNQQVKTYLFNNSTYDLGEPGIDSLYGYGALVLPDPYPANSNDTTVVANCNNTTVEEPEIAPCTVTPCSGPDCIVVTNGNDSGAGSLRQALADLPNGGTITFAPSVSIVNTASVITVGKNMTIDGCPSVTINGAGNHRLFMFNGNATININHITMQNGYRASVDNAGSSGAAFWVQGGMDLNLNDVIIQNNGGGARSGAVVIWRATLNCTRCFFLDNWSTGQGGALLNQDAVANFNQSVFRGNVALGDTLSDGTPQGASGGAILTFCGYDSFTSLSLTDCILEDNAANEGIGGGITISNNGNNRTTSVNIDNTVIDGNASYNGGGIAVVNTGTLLSVTNSRISSNIGMFGGGVVVANSNATATFNQCDIRDNSATYQGGGILVANDQATANLNQTTVSQNNAGYYGGGIANFGGIVNVTNTLIDHNASTNIGWAGGILSVSQRRDTTTVADDDDACLNIYNSTIADNLGVHNNGLLVVKDGTADSKLTIQNTILCNPSGNSEFKDYSNCDTEVVLTACGGNIACDTTAASIFTHPTDQNNTDPLFVDSENGNYNLQSCSPAIDAGQSNCEAPPTEDLACNNRDTTADSGAYEYTGGGSNGPIAYAGPDQFICPGDSIVIGSASMTNCGENLTYEWIPSAGLSDPYSATPVAQPPTSTLYQLIVTDANGYSTIDDVEIQVGPLVGIISGNAAVAENANGETYSVTNTAGSSYTWTLSDDAIAAGASIVSGQGTNQVVVNWGSEGGLLSVVETTMDGCAGVPGGIMVFLENCNDIYCPNPNNGSNRSGVFYGQATIDNIPAEMGDWIVAYDPDGNVAGATELTINGGIAYINLVIYGDDPSSPVDEGIGVGDTYFTLKLYDVLEGIELVHPNFANPIQFTGWGDYNGSPIPAYEDFTEVYDFESCTKDIIPLNPGWNLISFDVTLTNSSVAEVFSSLTPSNLQYVTGFDNGSTLYDPTLPPFLNSLSSIEDGYGYWVRVQVADVIEVCGTPIPATYKRNLDAGWNLIGYPSTNCIAPATYFDDLISTTNLIYATGFNQGSTLFDPDNPPFLNSLDLLCNGFGYWVKTNNAVATGNWLQYDPSALDTRSPGSITTTPVYTFLYGSSNLDASYIGNKIQVYATSSGILCGEIEVLDNGLLMTAPVYGDDLNTPEIEGALQGEELRFTINGMPMSGSFVFDGDLSPHEIYLSLEVVSSIADVQDKYQLSITPNPLASLTNINYVLEKEANINLKVINVHGQVIEVLFDDQKPAGKHSVSWDASTALPGTYLLSFEIDGTLAKTTKLIVIR